MFFVYPYSVDAPLYHWPITTVSIIVANVILFVLTTLQVAFGNLDPESIEWLMREYHHINPVQWLTSHFMHADLNHLIGNMIFLFLFGVVVEGKVGWAKMAGIYFGSCVAIGAVLQIPMYFLGGHGASLGASGVIMTLMVIAVFWAPENEISFFYFIWAFFRVFHDSIELRIYTVAMIRIALDVLDLALGGFGMSGATAHLTGAMIGVPIAIIFLRKGHVDCEGWDLISRHEWLQAYPALYGDEQRKQREAAKQEIQNPVAAALAVAGGDPSLADRVGLVSASHVPVQKASSQRRKPGKVSGKKARKKRSTKASREDSFVSDEVAQAHPEFARLSKILRQHLDSSNLSAAQQAFQRIDELKIGMGLSESILLNYTNALWKQRRWIDAIRPLVILIDKQGQYADDACLKVAQIQLKVLKRPDHVEMTLAKMSRPNVVDEHTRRRNAKKDQLRAAAAELRAVQRRAVQVQGEQRPVV